MNLLSKRDFLALTGGILLSPFVYAQRPEIAKEYDLIVLGSGFAGLACACHAAENGLKVALLEKEPVLGGSSAISRGSCLIAGTLTQRNQNIFDSPEALAKEMLDEDPRIQKDLAFAMTTGMLKEFEWLACNGGLLPRSLSTERKVPRVHQYDPHKLLRFLTNFAHTHGVEIFTGSRGISLITSNDTVEGVKVSLAHSPIEIQTNVGVAICTGGFSRNRRLMSRLAPQLANVRSIAAQGHTGDGHLMAEEVGANIIDCDLLRASYAFPRSPSFISDKTVVQYFGALIVNRKGKRFVDESLSYRTVSEKVLTQKGGESYLVFDSKVKEIAAIQEKDKEFWKLISQATKPDFAYVGTSIKEVAQNARIDSDTLIKTVEEFNAAARAGDLSKMKRGVLFDGRNPFPLDTPPFFIMAAFPCLLGTYAGIAIDSNARVLKNDHPLSGLWASGEVAGGMHGSSPLMGAPMASALAFGRAAGLNAAGVKDA